MEELKFTIQTFEGPLALLLSLIKKNEMNICDMQIHVIFDQYMDYMHTMEKLDIDIACEFITMASELMLIKSQMMLPRAAEAKKRIDELKEAIMAYANAKNAAQYLREQMAKNEGVAYREPQEPEIGIPLNYELKVLERAFKRMLARDKIMKDVQQRAPEKTLENLFKKRVTPIPEKVISVMRYLHRYGETDFERIILNNDNRSDVVATFAAILELIKFQRVFLGGDYDNPTLILNKSHNTKGQAVNADVWN